MICALLSRLVNPTINHIINPTINFAEKIVASPETPKVLSILGSGIKHGIYGAVDGLALGTILGAFGVKSIMNDPTLKNDRSASVPTAFVSSVIFLFSMAGGTVAGGTVGTIYGIAKKMLRNK